MEYSFTRQVTKHTRQHYSAGSLSATVVTEHTYGHRDRLLDTWKKLNSGTLTLVSSKGSTDIGQLHAKKLNTTNRPSFAEAVPYAYNARRCLLKAISPKCKQNLSKEQ